MNKLTSNQLVNKSIVPGDTITEALNFLRTSSGDGLGDMLKSIYDTDNDGKVDVAALADSVPWAGVSGKPSLFTPQAHNHPISEVTNLQNELNSKAASIHTHNISDVTNLSTTLDGKAEVSHSHVIGDVTGLSAALDSKQETLVSGTNIKTINGTPILGSGNITISGGGGGSGDVVGPLSSVDNSIAVFDGTTGKLIKDGGAAISSFATTAQLSSKQDTLVSGTNIKTVNGSSLLGSGNISVSGGTEPSEISITYNSDGSVATVTEDSVVKTFTYNSDSTVNTISWPVSGGLTRTQTYTYTNGMVTSMSTTEV